jgi:hypothetical protein
MSASTAIGDVTQTLEQLLINEQRPTGLFEVSLRSPADETITESMRPKVNLFLFRVVENAFARNQEWEAVGTEALHRPPLTVNLFYVLTPFAVDKLDEQRVLGEAMRVFYDHPVIAAPLLRGGLEHTTEELNLDLYQLSLEDLARIWSALTRPYRLSIAYEVRMAVIDSTVERTVRRVIEREERYVRLP